MSDIAWQLWLLAFGIVLSGVFSGAETALTALGVAHSRRLYETGGTRGRMLALWVHAPERVLSGLLVGNTLINVGCGTLAANIMVGLGRPTWMAAAAGAVTLLLLAFGEITPKMLAKANPERFALLFAPFATLVAYLMFPASWLLLQMPRAFLRARVVGQRPMPSVTGEEIEYLIGLSGREGVLDSVKQQLLNSVLKFSDRITKEVMVPRTRVVAVDVEASYADAARVVTDSGHSRIPAYRESIDTIVGIFYAKALLADLRVSERPSEFQVKRYVKPAFFVPEQMKVSRLLREFQRRRMHLAVVVDEFGGTSGIVTLEDVVEEIVGEIQDESDVDETAIKALDSGAVLVEATIGLRELGDHLKVTFPDEGGYETLGGFLTATAGKVPPVGAVIAWGGWTFTVRAADERRVTRVEIAKKIIGIQDNKL